MTRLHSLRDEYSITLDQFGFRVGRGFGFCRRRNEVAGCPNTASRLQVAAGDFGSVWQRETLEIIERDVALPDGVVLEKDIEYGNAGGHSLQLDLYRPAKITKPVPALLFIHGGAWKSGKRQDYHFYTAAYAEKGYVVATATYRLVGQAPFPAAVQDCKCAVRWLRANAKKYNIDPAQNRSDRRLGGWASLDDAGLLG